MPEQSGQPKVVGIWIRVSTEDQVKGESPEHHEKRARAYAEARGWEVAEIYRLEAVSGKSVMGHHEAQRMLADLRSGAITGLVFSKLARLARNTRELLEFSEIFRACGADLVSLQEAIDTSSPAGRLFFTMIAAMAQWEREEIAERVQASVPVRAKLGKPLGGAAPFGYRWVDKKLQPDPTEAPVRVLLHELFLEHRRRKTVARILNERGYRTRNGSLFSDTTVARLLEDPTAKGLHRANYTRTDDRTGSWELKPESDWVYTPVEPIISEALWEECASLVASQRESVKRPARKSQHLFAGFAYCECGQKMYVWKASPKYICSACRNKIPMDDLEAIFREQLRHFLISPEEIEAYDQAADGVRAERERLVVSAESELKRLTNEEDSLFQLYAAGALSKADFARRHAPVSERRGQLTDELPRLQAELDVLRIRAASRYEALGEARDLADRWGDLPHEEKRQIVEALTDRLVIGRAEVEVVLLHLPLSGIRSDMATRPCRCGHGGPGKGACGKAPRCQRDYQGRISGPMLDRIDLAVDVPPVTAADLALPPPAEGTAEAAARVAAAREIQLVRAAEEGLAEGTLNARAEGEGLDRILRLDEAAKSLMSRAAEAGAMTARGWTRTLRLARTIADLDASEGVRRVHAAEALVYRRTAPGMEGAPALGRMPI